MSKQWINQLKEHSIEKNLIKTGDHIIIGLSGGVDSVALLIFLNKIKEEFLLELYPIHVHHGIRDDADKDVDFCQQLCQELGLGLHVVYVDVPGSAKLEKRSEEEVARNLRYEALRAYLKELNAQVIAVAHHKDDQAETVLHRFLRGSGMHGLIGMKARNGEIIRPFLKVSKKELVNFVETEGFGHIIDSTNTDTKYTRNHIRHELIPYLEEHYNENLVNNLNRLSTLLEDDEEYMMIQAKEFFNKVCLSCEENQSIVIDSSTLGNCAVSLQRRIIRIAISKLKGDLNNIEYIHIQRVMDLLKSQSGKSVPLINNLVVQKEYETLVFKKNKKTNKNHIGFTQSLDTVPITGYIQNANLEYGLRQLNQSEYKELINYKDSFKISKNVYTKWFDYDKIKANLVLRSREPGDFIHIHKDGGTKTIKKFFIDEKIKESLRDNIPLLAVGKEIVWIVGYRENPMYLVSIETRHILEVKLLKEDKNGKY